MRAQCPGSSPSARIGAVAFVHRFGSTLNAHLHFDCVVIEGVFEPLRRTVSSSCRGRADENAIGEVQVRRRLLCTFVRRRVLAGSGARAMAQWEHWGRFSVDGSVRIVGDDRVGTQLSFFGDI